MIIYIYIYILCYLWTLLALLGLQAHCQHVQHTCLLWHNHIRVATHRRTLIDLHHGDYVRVAVPPAAGGLDSYYTREVAQCLRRGYSPANIPALLENFPNGLDVSDMPILDTFNYIPSAEDLDYDRDAMSLMQVQGVSRPAFDPWPEFLSMSHQEHPLHCKVGDQDLREPADLENEIQPPPEQGRPELIFREVARFLQVLQPVWMQQAAIEIEEEGRVLYVNVWYSDHDRFPRCDAPRPARLSADVWNWPDRLAEAC